MAALTESVTDDVGITDVVAGVDARTVTDATGVTDSQVENFIPYRESWGLVPVADVIAPNDS